MNWLTRKWNKLTTWFWDWRLDAKFTPTVKTDYKRPVVEDSYERFPSNYSTWGKATKKGFMCFCSIGRILPRYRKGRSPTYKCNHCDTPYVPQVARSSL